MEQRRRNAVFLLAVGIVAFALALLPQECGMNNPVPPYNTSTPTCTRPGAPLMVLLFWLAAGILVLLGAVLYRRAKVE